MSLKTYPVNTGNKVSTVAGLVLLAASHAVMAEEWSAPAPLGPFGGHFDFGLPTAEEVRQQSKGSTGSLQAEHAMYRKQGDELPVIQAAYEPDRPAVSISGDFNEVELSLIYPAWQLESSQEEAAAAGFEMDDGDIWALGELESGKRVALGSHGTAGDAQPHQMAKLEPCTVPYHNGSELTSAQTPYQEAVLDEFVGYEMDMEALAREADQLSKTEEQQGERQAPVYFSSFIPDYALGVRRANAMDPLALSPQMRGPVQYFGFQK